MLFGLAVLLAALPLEPDPSDLVIDSAGNLVASLISVVAGGTISLHLTGHLRLSEVPMAEPTTILPMIGTGMSVTLWSHHEATLDAEGLGRIFKIAGGGKLLLQGVEIVNGHGRGQGGCGLVKDVTSLLLVRDSYFFNCSAWGGTQGGGVAAQVGATVRMSGTTFEECEVTNDAAGFDAFGGGVAVYSANVTLIDVRFEGTRAVSGLAFGFGGGVGLLGGTLNMIRVTFIDTECDGNTAYGGGLGVMGGATIVGSSSWLRTRAISRGAFAWGGGIGCNAAGAITIYDSSIESCAAIGARVGEGGGAGAATGTTLALFNVTIVASTTSSPELGRDVWAQSPKDLTAAQLTLRGGCAHGDTSTRLIGFDNSAPMLLRDLSLDVPGCPMPPLIEGSTLAQCTTPGVAACGPQTECTMSGDSLVPTPRCVCKAPDWTQPFVQPMPSPTARRPELAPYTEAGCSSSDALPPADRQLNPNWWRAAANTSDVRPCVAFWSKDEPTPCRGGSLGLGTVQAYCNPGHEGARCQACVSTQYYRISSASCVDCPSRASLAAPIVAVVMTVIGGSGVLYAVLWRWPLRCTLLERAAAIVPRLGVTGKLKVAFGYFQVVLVMPEAFNLQLPPRYFEWMRAFEWVSLDTSLVVPGACLGDFGTRLQLKALGPIVLLAVLILVGAASGLVARRSAPMSAEKETYKGILDAAVEGVLRTLPFNLAMIFAFVPTVAARIFSTFSCEQFGIEDNEDGTPRATRGFLHADAGVVCGSEEHGAFVSLAAMQIVVWPIGVPLLFYCLMRVASRDSRARSELWRATAFLHSDYHPEMCHWEVSSKHTIMLPSLRISLPPLPFNQRRCEAVSLSLCPEFAHSRWHSNFILPTAG